MLSKKSMNALKKAENKFIASFSLSENDQVKSLYEIFDSLNSVRDEFFEKNQMILNLCKKIGETHE